MPAEHSGVNWTTRRERITIPVGGGHFQDFQGNFSKVTYWEKIAFNSYCLLLDILVRVK